MPPSSDSHSRLVTSGVTTSSNSPSANTRSGPTSATPAPVRGEGGKTLPGWMRRLLRVPLAGKLAGANAFIVVVALGVVALVHEDVSTGPRSALLLIGALVGSAVVNLILVVVALRPLADLEATARRIWRGDLSARVAVAPLSGGDLARVGGAVNVLLDGLAADRARLRDLASRVIRAGDDERAHIARELHDSTAQSMAALLLELSVVMREPHDAATVQRLERIRRISADVLDEVRMLAHTVHPRVLDDLGLGAAFQHLARESEARASVRVEVVVEDSAAEIGREVSSVLYRVAQEALNNAVKHAHATTVLLRAAVREHVARLEVSDDGVGFRPDDAERRRPGMGLFTMRERMALVDGTLLVQSAPGRGTRVIASVPLHVPVHAAGPPGAPAA